MITGNGTNTNSSITPIAFQCSEILPGSPDDIVSQMLELQNWNSFQGYGPLPGIKSAEFDVQTPELLGTRIRVTNRDGSSHVETITDWQHGQVLQMTMNEFTPPLSKLATHFLETWNFQPEEQGTRVTRSFELYPTSSFAKLSLWIISFLLKKAIRRHMQLIKAGK